MRKVAVTGGLACGKSSVCDFLRELGATTVSADLIVHDLLSPQTEIGKQVIDLLGSDILESGQVKREQIAKKVFNDPKLLAKLESLIHPAVADKIDMFCEEAGRAKAPLFVAEVPLLFEVGLEGRFDLSVAVVSDRDLPRPTHYFVERMERQLPTSEKAQRADFVLTNNGSLQELKEATKKLYTQLLEE